MRGLAEPAAPAGARMLVGGHDLLGMACVPSRSHLIDDRELLEVVGGAAVEGHDLFELGRGRRIVLIPGPDEVADWDFFDRLGGGRRASVGRAATLASGRPLPDLQKECCKNRTCPSVTAVILARHEKLSRCRCDLRKEPSLANCLSRLQQATPFCPTQRILSTQFQQSQVAPQRLR